MCYIKNKFFKIKKIILIYFQVKNIYKTTITSYHTLKHSLNLSHINIQILFLINVDIKNNFKKIKKLF
jgi:hypothetical protein